MGERAIARDGSGNYSRVVTPPNNGDIADADDFNVEIDDIATALSDSINKNGTKAFAADQSMGGYKLTDLAAPANANDAARKAYVDGIVGTTAQPLDATLTALAALSYTSGTLVPTMTASDTFALVDAATFIRTTGAQTAQGIKRFANTGASNHYIEIENQFFVWRWGFNASAYPSITNSSGQLIWEYDTNNNRHVWRDVSNNELIKLDNSAFTYKTAAVRVAGKTAVPIPASAMVANTTNGAASGLTETTTNKVMVRTLDFDATTQEGAQFDVPSMPKGWNEGTITFVPVWTASAGTPGETVVWELRLQAQSDDDPLDGAWGTGQTSSDTFIATGDRHIGPESAAITVGGSPAEGDGLVGQIRRVVASDNLSADAKLIGIRLLITLNAANDQ